MEKKFNLFERFTSNAKQSLLNAQEISKKKSQGDIDTDDILFGMFLVTDSVGSRLLKNFGFTNEMMHTESAEKDIISELLSEEKNTPEIFTEPAKTSLDIAMGLGKTYQSSYIGTEHILRALLMDRSSKAYEFLKKNSLRITALVSELDKFLQRGTNEGILFMSDEDMLDMPEEMRGGGVYGRPFAPKNHDKSKILETYGVDFTEKAKNNEFDPIIGREKEIARVISILNRRTKNNPVLIGEPGVGKTALVEGLSQKIVSEDIPDLLSGKRVLMLDMAGVIAGTKYRGEFEERLKKIVDALKEDKEIILFIDELHTIVGAGAAEGAIDAANILKPALSRGEIQVIGATTFDDYRKYIEKDAALERRFQPIVVSEPTPEETLDILKGIREKYEEYHKVKITDDSLDAAVKLSKRYISDRFLPDKAIDLIDEAASLLKIKSGKNPSKSLKEFQKELKETVEKKEEAVIGAKYIMAAEYKQKEELLEAKIRNLKKAKKSYHKPEITAENIAEVVSISTGVPITRLIKKESESLLNLEKNLKKRIIGQDEAIKEVAGAIRRSRTGISNEKRPIGTFIFLGPTGVGKTELAKALAAEMFSSEDMLVKIDMSEFMEKHNIARLVGAPAGYVGYEEGGQLTEIIRRKPYSVILLDEIEKAHSDVFNMFLQILEDGYLTDAKGVKVDFRNTIIIMTSNVGAERMFKTVKLGFSAENETEEKELETLHKKISEEVMETVKKKFRPEFINRVDKIIVFKALSRFDVKKIVNLQLKELTSRLAEKNITIKVSESAKKLLIEKGYDIENGARPMRRTIENLVESPLAEGMLSGEFKEGDLISVMKMDESLQFYVLQVKADKRKINSK